MQPDGNDDPASGVDGRHARRRVVADGGHESDAESTADDDHETTASADGERGDTATSGDAADESAGAADDTDAEADDDHENAMSAEGEAVSVDEVTHVADLARVNVAESEAATFASQFADILSYFETLDEVPEVESEATLTNVMRPDEEREGLSQSAALANAAETEEGYFKGPRVS